MGTFIFFVLFLLHWTYVAVTNLDESCDGHSAEFEIVFESKVDLKMQLEEKFTSLLKKYPNLLQSEVNVQSTLIKPHVTKRLVTPTNAPIKTTTKRHRQSTAHSTKPLTKAYKQTNSSVMTFPITTEKFVTTTPSRGTSTMETSTDSTQTTVNLTTLPDCYFTYKEKRFRVILSSNIAFAAGKGLCENNGMHLANIYDELHYNETKQYVLQNILPNHDQVNIHLWTGMTYENDQIKLTYGNTSHNLALEWPKNYPVKVSENTNIVVTFDKNPKAEEGLLNYAAHNEAAGSLCQSP
uniref:uncharacterized protein LOC120334969 n=1 Tax=Styela clava TaxID=7725 RepID=UPI00193989C0|nr:uncharacterized protein LOC120334969 [Styela clava]